MIISGQLCVHERLQQASSESQVLQPNRNLTMVGEYLSFASIKVPEFHGVTRHARILLITLIVFLGPRGISETLQLKLALRRMKHLSSKLSSLLSKLKMYSRSSSPLTFDRTCPRPTEQKIIIIYIYMFDSHKMIFLTRLSSGKIHHDVSRPCFDVPSPLFLR